MPTLPHRQSEKTWKKKQSSQRISHGVCELNMGRASGRAGWSWSQPSHLSSSFGKQELLWKRPIPYPTLAMVSLSIWLWRCLCWDKIAKGEIFSIFLCEKQLPKNSVCRWIRCSLQTRETNLDHSLLFPPSACTPYTFWTWNETEHRNPMPVSQ